MAEKISAESPVVILIVSKSFGEADWILPVLAAFKEHPRLDFDVALPCDRLRRNNFIILDSLHTKAHVLSELAAYSDLVGPGSYCIVEDSNLNGHPLLPCLHPQTAMAGGPFEAIEEFLKERKDFRIDTALEKRFLFSFAPSGYLVKQ